MQFEDWDWIEYLILVVCKGEDSTQTSSLIKNICLPTEVLNKLTTHIPFTNRSDGGISDCI